MKGKYVTVAVCGPHESEVYQMIGDDEIDGTPADETLAVAAITAVNKIDESYQQIINYIIYQRSIKLDR